MNYEQTKKTFFLVLETTEYSWFSAVCAKLRQDIKDLVIFWQT